MSLIVRHERIGEHLLVRIVGDVDVETATRLTDVLVAASALDTNGMIVDLTATTFFGASGLAALVNVAGHGHDMGSSLVVITPRHSVIRRIITLTSLTDVIPVADTVRDAQHLLRARRSSGK